MDIKSIISLSIVDVIFMSIGIALFVCGLQKLDIIKPRSLDKSKWTQTTAKILGFKYISERKRYKGHKNNYLEYTIVYKAYGKEYKKYIRDLPTGKYNKISIYYKKNNPNYIKVKFNEPHNPYSSRPVAAILFIMGICIFASGGIIMSKVIKNI